MVEIFFLTPLQYKSKFEEPQIDSKIREQLKWMGTFFYFYFFFKILNTEDKVLHCEMKTNIKVILNTFT